ncbi:hypothetical protein [Calycomorphotria hydatis]|uniref:Uncharacterized protein n=1 Tax=Calycomorphotria hydatis TaxID=2528027 RepID=A0A517T4B3_9PLAN|nr:hypothetical protein [Calycomorphotria hydatis]QDT63214.1 hypothetical protein V22_04320 [Calycomorphotria hydatis]
MLLVSWLQSLYDTHGPRALTRRRKSNSREVQLGLRRLEPRRLLNATPVAAALDASGTGDDADGTVSIDDLGGITVDAGQFSDDGEDDTFSVSRVGDDLRIFLNGDPIFEGDASSITKLTFNGSSDNDLLIIDQSIIDASEHIPIFYDGGAGIDALEINGGTAQTVTFNHTNANDGTIDFDTDGGGTDLTVQYAGLEPITNSGTATDIVLNLTAVNDVAVLEDFGTNNDGMVQLRDNGTFPGTFEDTIFNVTGVNSVTINTATTGGQDSIDVTGLDTTWTADLIIQGDSTAGEEDVVRFLTNTTDTNGGDINITAHEITVDAAITTDGGNVDFTSGGIVDINAGINTDGGDFASSGTTFDNTGGSILTGAGTVTINHTASVTIGAAITSTNGSATAIDIDGDGITIGANVSTGATGTADYNAGTGAITGTGTTTAGTVNLTASTGIGSASAINVSANEVTFANTTGNVQITEANAATFSGTNAGTGNVNLITTLGNLTVGTADIVTNGGAVTFNAQQAGGSVISALGANVATNNSAAGAAITIISDELQLDGNINSGSGLVTIRPQDTTRAIAVGSVIATPALDITSAELTRITSTGGLTIGSASHTGNISTTGSVAPTNVTGGVLLFETGGVGTVAILGAGSVNSGVATTFRTNTGNIILSGGSVTTSDDTITFDGTVRLDANATINSGAGAGDVIFNDTINADDSTSNDRALTVTAGLGTVLFTSAIGTGTNGQLADLDVTAALTRFGGNVQLDDNDATAATAAINSAVQLDANVTFDLNKATGTDNSISFTGAVNADDSSTQDRTLTVDAGTGTVTFGSTVGTGANGALADLDVTAGTTNFGGNVTVNDGAAAEVSLQSNVILTSDVTFLLAGTNDHSLNVTGTIDDDVAAATRTLIVNAGASTITFGGNIGNTRQLAALTTTGGTTINAATVSTSGTQTYNNAVTLGTDVTFTASTVSFKDTVDGTTPNNEKLTVTGNAVFGDGTGSDLVGNSVTLEAVDVSGSTTINSTSIKTNGTHEYGGAVTLTTDVTLIGSNISFDSTVDGTTAGTEGLAITGNAVFGDGTGTDDVGLTKALEFLTVSGTTVIDAATVNTEGLQTYSNTVIIAQDTIINADDGNVSFVGTIDSDQSELNSLVVNTTGVTSFGGVIGNADRLSTLTTNAGGRTELAGGLINTNGSTVTYNDAVLLKANTTINEAGAGNVTFNSTVDSEDGNNFTLSVNTAAGATIFNGAVGSDALGALSDDAGLGSVSTNSAGTTQINGGSVTTTGTQTYNDAVTLGADTTLTGSTISFASTLNGTTAGMESLAITGNASFGGVVGGTALEFLTVSGTTTINTAGITTAGLQTFTSTVIIAQDTTINADDGNVSFVGTIDSDQSELNSLVVNTTGVTSFGGVIGNADRLSALTTNAGGRTELAGGLIKTNGSTVTYNDAVLLKANTTISEVGAGNVTFNSTVDSEDGNNFTLNVNTAAGATIFNGAVGSDALGALSDDAGLGSVSTNSAGTTQINGGSVTTTGTQTYNDAVTLGADTTLTGTTISFASTLNGTTAGMESLAITGNASFSGVVGSTALEFLTVSGTTTINSSTISTSGVQTYDGAVTLGADTNLTGSIITFNDDVDGTTSGMESLTVTGNAVLGDTTGVDQVGNSVALEAFQITGTTLFAAVVPIANGAHVTTTGLQQYGGNATLQDDVRLKTSDGAVTFGGTVNADAAANDRSLSIDAGTGNVTFQSTVGDSEAIKDLTVSQSGTTQFDDNITTRGNVSVMGTTIVLSANVDLNTTAADTAGNTGTVEFTATQNILLDTNSSITTADDAITLLANTQATTTTGNFVGIDLVSATVQSTSGEIQLSGVGGDTLTDNFGVNVGAGSSITASGNSLTITGKSGNDIAINIAGALAGSGVNPVTLLGDTLNIAATGTVTNSQTGEDNRVIIAPLTTGVAIDLGGADVVATPILGLTDAELDQITADILQIGNKDGSNNRLPGSISITEDITFTVDTVHLITGGGITDEAGDTLTATNLAFEADETVTLDSAHSFGTVAATVFDSAEGFTLTEADGFTVGEVDGVIGITTNNGPISLTANDNDIFITENIAAGTSTVTFSVAADEFVEIQQSAIAADRPIVSGTGGISVTSGTLFVSALSDGNADQLKLIHDGTDFVVTDFDTVSNSDVELARFRSATGLRIDGEDDQDSTLTVDFTNFTFAAGDPINLDTVTFNGGTTSGSDALVLNNGTFDTVTHNFTNETDGDVQLTQLSTSTTNFVLNYTGLDPIADNLSATNRVFNFNTTAGSPAGSETITLQDVADAGGLDLMQIDSNIGSETTTFVIPTGSLTINAGAGDDEININSLDADWSPTTIITVNGDAGADQLNIDYGGGDSLGVDGVTINYFGGNPTTSTGDSLVLTNGNPQTVNHSVTSAGNGAVTIDPDGTGTRAATTVNYAELEEPISDQFTPLDRTFQFGVTDDIINIDDDGTAGNGVARILLGAVPIIDFGIPTVSFSVLAGGGDDTINWLLDTEDDGSVEEAGYRAATQLDGEADGTNLGDQINIDADLFIGSATSGTFNTDDALFVSAEVITVGPNVDINTTAASTNSRADDISLIAGRSLSVVNATITAFQGVIDLSGNATNIGGTFEFTGVTLSQAAINSITTINIFGRGNGTGDDRDGVLINVSSRIDAMQIRIEGIGSAEGGNFNDGVAITDHATTVGSITLAEFIDIDGIGGGTNVAAGTQSNRGVLIADGSNIYLSDDGSLDIDGFGGGTDFATSQNNDGVFIGLLNASPLFEPFIWRVGAFNTTDTLHISGATASGGDNNMGVHFRGDGVSTNIFDSLILSNVADIIIDNEVDGISAGQQRAGGSPSTLGSNNVGVLLDGAYILGENGFHDRASVTIKGTGGNGDSSNTGVRLINSSLIEAGALIGEDGLVITGIGGGESVADSDLNRGVEIIDSRLVVEDGFFDDGGDGALRITGTGAGGTGDSGLNDGVYFSNSSIQHGGFNTSTVVAIAGNAGGTGNDNRGVVIENGSFINSRSAEVQITGVGGLGINTNGGVEITSGSTVRSESIGSVSIAGTAQGTGLDNDGVEIDDSEIIVQNNGSVSVNASVSIIGVASGTNNSEGVQIENLASVNSRRGKITIDGTSNAIGGVNAGVLINDFSLVSATSGDIEVIGEATTGTNGNIGVVVLDSDLETTIGSIAITGSSLATGNLNHGVEITDSSTVETTGTGSVTIKGTGGPGLNENSGVEITDGAAVGSTGGGIISITGTATGAAEDNDGVEIDDATVSTTDDGTITITGTATGSNGSEGVQVDDSAIVESENGLLKITGTSNATGNLNHGVTVNASAVRTTQDGSISIEGTGGPGLHENSGVEIIDGASVRALGGGSVDIKGTTRGTGVDNDGVEIDEGIVDAVSSGTVTITGIGTGTDATEGVQIEDLSTVRTEDGLLKIDGTSNATGNGNSGVLIAEESKVVSTGGNIQIDGKATAGVDETDGVFISLSSVTSVDGTIEITGSSAATGNLNNGVVLTSGLIETVGDGEIYVTGTGGAGTNSNGILLTGTTGLLSAIQSAEPLIQLESLGRDILVANEFASITSTNGDIVFCSAEDVILNGPVTATNGTIGIKAAGNVIQDANGIILASALGVISTNGSIDLDNADNNVTTFAASAADDIFFHDINTLTIGTVAAVLDANGDLSCFDTAVTGVTSGTDATDEIAIKVDAGPLNINQVVSVAAGNLGLAAGGDIIQNADGVLTANLLGAISTNGLIDLNNASNDANVFAAEAPNGISFLDVDDVTISTVPVISCFAGVAGLTTTNGGNIDVDAVTIIVAANTAVTTAANALGDVLFDATRNIAMNAGSSIMTVGGAILLNANVAASGTGNFTGIQVTNSTIQTTSGTVSLTGRGGTTGSANSGVELTGNLATVTSVDGNILLKGTGGGTDAIGSSANNGVVVANGAEVFTNGTGDVALIGVGGQGESENNGVSVSGTNSLVFAIDGDISILGTGGGNTLATADNNRGITIVDNALVTISGAGSIELDGVGGGAVGLVDNNDGVLIGSLDATASVGMLSHTGTVDSGQVVVISGSSVAGGSDNNGVLIQGAGAAANVISSRVADITIDNLVRSAVDRCNVVATTPEVQGSGGGVAGNVSNNVGVHISNGAVITTSENVGDDANITISGMGGTAGFFAHGVSVTGINTAIRSSDGSVDLNGVSQRGPFSNGVQVIQGANVNVSGMGSIEIDGFAEGGISASNGVLIGRTTFNFPPATQLGSVTHTGTLASATDPRPTVTISGASSSSNIANNGVEIAGNSAATDIMVSSIVADIVINNESDLAPSAAEQRAGGSVTGSGGIGVFVLSSTIRSLTGGIEISGFGGNGPSNNAGVSISSAIVETEGRAADSFGSGDLVIKGQGGGENLPSGDFNRGVLINQSAIQTTGTSSNIEITGFGGQGDDENIGVLITGTNSTVQSIDGDICIHGFGGGSDDAGSDANHGVAILSGASVNSTGDGTIAISGIAGGDQVIPDNQGIFIESTTTAISSLSSSVLLQADSMNIDAAIQAANSVVQLTPLTDGLGMSIGAEVVGELSLTGTELANITSRILTLGGLNVVPCVGDAADAGTITVRGTDSLNMPGQDLVLLTAANVFGESGLLDVGTGTITFDVATGVSGAGTTPVNINAGTIAGRVRTSGDFRVSDADDLIVGNSPTQPLVAAGTAVPDLSGITAPGNVSIDTVGSLTVNEEVSAGVNLDITSQANVFLNATTTSIGRTLIEATLDILQPATDVFVIGDSVGLSGRNVGLVGAAIDIQTNTFAGRSTNGTADGGVIVNQDALGGDIEVGTVNGLSGIDADGLGSILFTTESGSVIVSAAVNSEQNTTFDITGSMTSNAAIGSTLNTTIETTLFQTFNAVLNAGVDLLLNASSGDIALNAAATAGQTFDATAQDGSITQPIGTTHEVTATEGVFRASDMIGSPTKPIFIDMQTVAATAPGGVYFTSNNLQTGTLSVGDVNGVSGITSSAGNVQVEVLAADGNLDVNSAINAAIDIIMSAANIFTVNAEMNAGDDLTLTSATNTSPVAAGTDTLIIAAPLTATKNVQLTSNDGNIQLENSVIVTGPTPQINVDAENGEVDFELGYLETRTQEAGGTRISRVVNDPPNLVGLFDEAGNQITKVELGSPFVVEFFVDAGNKDVSVVGGQQLSDAGLSVTVEFDDDSDESRGGGTTQATKDVDSNLVDSRFGLTENTDEFTNIYDVIFLQLRALSAGANDPVVRVLVTATQDPSIRVSEFGVATTEDTLSLGDVAPSEEQTTLPVFLLPSSDFAFVPPENTIPEPVFTESTVVFDDSGSAGFTTDTNSVELGGAAGQSSAGFENILVLRVFSADPNEPNQDAPVPAFFLSKAYRWILAGVLPENRYQFIEVSPDGSEREVGLPFYVRNGKFIQIDDVGESDELSELDDSAGENEESASGENVDSSTQEGERGTTESKPVSQQKTDETETEEQTEQTEISEGPVAGAVGIGSLASMRLRKRIRDRQARDARQMSVGQRFRQRVSSILNETEQGRAS